MEKQTRENVITINGHRYPFEEGETILQVAQRNHIFIPTLCYLKGTQPTGACRICIVEAKGSPGFLSSCTTPAAAGMEVSTETRAIREARRTILEMLLISGNHNCSVRGLAAHEWTDFQQGVEEYDGAGDICAAYGECQLQALAYRYMVTEKKLDSLPVSYPLENEDTLIGRDFSRCILCGRCVAACNEIQVNGAISYGYRGMRAKIAAAGDQPLPHSDCVTCGECVQVCPTAALFENNHRFTRSWEIEHLEATCFFCGLGCRLDVQVRKKDKHIVRVRGAARPQAEAGQYEYERLCKRGRFDFAFMHSEKRLTRPLLRRRGDLTEVSWDEALQTIAVKIKAMQQLYGDDSIGCTVSCNYSNEDLAAANRFFREVVGSTNIFHFHPPVYPGIDLESLKQASQIVVLGADITAEHPVAGSYVKQAALAGVPLVVVDSRPTGIAKFATSRLTNMDDLGSLERILQGDRIVVIVDPRSVGDISWLAGKENIQVFSLALESNAVGAYQLGIESIARVNYDLGQMKMMVTLGSHFIKRENIEFLVVQEFLANDCTAIADVVLPAAVWLECGGTIVSSDGLVKEVGKALEPPGEARPAAWIFHELSQKMKRSS